MVKSRRGTIEILRIDKTRKPTPISGRIPVVFRGHLRAAGAASPLVPRGFDWRLREAIALLPGTTRIANSILYSH